MTNLLSQFISESLLVEKSRYERETGNDSAEELRQKIMSLASDTHPVPYAFTMTKIPKVGLNPQTSYDTPAGVYFYPLTKEYCKKLIDNKLPFVSDNHYFGVVKLKNLDSSLWLKFLVDQRSFQTDEDYERVVSVAGKKIAIEASKKGKHNYFNNDSRIFDISYFYTQNSAGKYTSTWNKFLRKLGYIGIYDAGNGIIHPSEPTQLVCLSSEAYETVGIWETKELRKRKLRPSDLKDLSRIQKMGLAVKRASPEILRILSKDDKFVRKIVASNPKCPKDILAILSIDDDFDVRIKVASNPKCPIEILQNMSHDGDWTVREAVAENPVCSIEILNDLVNDVSMYIRKVAAKQLSCRT